MYGPILHGNPPHLFVPTPPLIYYCIYANYWCIYICLFSIKVVNIKILTLCLCVEPKNRMGKKMLQLNVSCFHDLKEVCNGVSIK